MSRARWHRFACIAFVLMTASLHFVAALPAGRRGEGYLVAHGLLTAAMLLAWWSARGVAPAWALGAGIVARVVLVATPSFTTSDVTRYLWDGHLALMGLDPYRIAPANPLVAGLRATWLPTGVHDDLPTLYPPGALALFGIAALAGPTTGVAAWKGITTAASLSILWAGHRVLCLRGRERHLALIALSPLMVLEGGVGAHVDVIAAAALMLGLACFDTDRLTAAGRWLGVGLLVKFVPVLAVLPLAVRSERPWRLLGGKLVVAATGYGITVLFGLLPVGSISAVRSWRFGSPVWSVLETAFGTEYAGAAAVVLTVWALVFALRAAISGRQDAGIQLALVAPLIASPVVYPWYLVPLASTVALAPSATALAWLSTMPLTYEVIDRADTAGVWEPSAWPLFVITIVVGVAAIADLARQLVSRRRAGASVPEADVARPVELPTRMAPAVASRRASKA